jgi:hypothetical protein
MVSPGEDRRARFLAAFAKAFFARCECSQPTATKGNGGQEWIRIPATGQDRQLSDFPRGEGEDPAKGQRRQSSAASGLFESSIDNGPRTGEKQAAKKGLPRRVEGEGHRRRRRQVRSGALPPEKDGLLEIRGLDLELGR